MTKLIDRPTYTQRILPFVGKNIIKVLTGQRRVGKSYMLKQLCNHIEQTQPEANTIYINKEYEQFIALRTNEDLSAYVDERLVAGKANYLFVDEVQEISGFEHALRSLQAQELCDIFITGSNATMLSGELSTHLAGRYVEFQIHSLNYEEFLEFHTLQDTTDSLRKYLTFGGLPYLSNLVLDEDVAFEYLRNVYSTILLKDVVKREAIRNVEFLETLALYTADNVGNLFSANNISRYLKSQRVNISPLQVINYLRALQNAYIIHKVQRIDVNGLRKFEIGDKYYYEDLGLRNCHVGFNLGADISKLIENAVYLHLSQLGYDVFTGQQTGGKEIDFVARRKDAIVYVQATYLLADESTRQREFGNLQSIHDNYPKYVVSLDEWGSGSNVEGIRHLYLSDFLKRKDFS